MEKNKNEDKVFIKPVLNYNQVVEIIDSRISEIEKASEQIIRDKQKSKNQAKANKKPL